MCPTLADDVQIASILALQMLGFMHPGYKPGRASCF